MTGWARVLEYRLTAGGQPRLRERWPAPRALFGVLEALVPANGLASQEACG